MNQNDKRQDESEQQNESSDSVAGDAADKNLLFGILAVQMNFISQQSLIAAMNTWVLDKRRSLRDVLIKLRLMQPQYGDMLEQQLVAHLQEYGNDAKQCLAALSSITSIKTELEKLQDPELTLILSHAMESQVTQDSSEGKSSAPVETPGSRFQILRPHAKGGLGQVSVALDKELNREVALKEIQKQHLADNASRERFVLEAEITGGLQHPGIVPVYGLGKFADGSPFYAMRFIRGESLKSAIELYHGADNQSRVSTGKRRLELRKLLGRFIDVCNAIEYAHSRGILHRDLKPGNIMLGKYGETLVVDWGLAKALGQNEIESEEPTLLPSSAISSSEHTRPGSALGTPAYMSPEQAAGKLDELGPETDVYSLGATMYHLLTGRAPFTGKTADVLKLVQQGEFIHPRRQVPEIPLALEAICVKAMSLKPSDRYESPRQLAEDVERWLADEPVKARSETWSERLTRLERKHRTLVRAGSLSLAIIAVLAVGAALWINVERGRNARLAINEGIAKTDAMNAKKVAEKATDEALKAKEVAVNERARADLNASDATRKATELQIQLAKTHFQHGIREFETGKASLGAQDLANAVSMIPQTHELRASYERLLVDRLTGGGKNIPFPSSAVSPDGTRILLKLLVDGKMVQQIVDSTAGTAIGMPIRSEEIWKSPTFSSDNRLLVAMSSYNTIQVWDATSGVPTGRLEGHTGPITQFVISPDGNRLLSGAWDNTARLWDLTTTSQIGNPLQHQGQVKSVEFSPDGLLVATASGDFCSRLWDGKTGESLGVPMTHNGTVYAIAFSPSGSRLLTGSGDRTARLWDGRTGNSINNPIQLESTVSEVSWGPEGTSFVTVTGNVSRLWNSSSSAQIGDVMRMTEPISSVEFSPDGARIATSSVDGTSQIWDARTALAVTVPMKSIPDSLPAKFLPDSTRLYSGRTRWEAFSAMPIRNPIATEQPIMELRISPDGKRILAAVGSSILVWNSETQTPMGELVRDDALIYSFAMSADGQRLVTGTASKLQATAENPNRQIAYARIWDATSGEQIGTPMEHSGLVMDVAISPDGTRVATGCRDGGVRIWDIQTGVLQAGPLLKELSLAGQLGIPINKVVFSPDGKRLAVATDRAVGVWNVPDLTLNHLFASGHSVGTKSIAFSPNGKYLVTTGRDRMAHVFDSLTGTMVGEPMPHDHDQGLHDVAFSPDGQTLVTAVDAHAARLWDVRTGTAIGEALPHYGITNVAFTPDGTRLVSSSLDKTLLIWDVTQPRQPNRLLDWVSLMTGDVFKEPDLETPLTPAQQEEQSELFKKDYAEWLLAVSSRQADRCRRFQVAAARDAEHRRDWFAAEFHLRHLAKSEPNDEALKMRLAIAKQRLVEPVSPVFTNLTPEEFERDVNIADNRGFRPTKLETSVSDGAVLYSGEFVRNSPKNLKWRYWYDQNAAAFDQRNADLTSQGFLLDSHATATINGELRHAAVWTFQPVRAAFSGLNALQYHLEFNQARDQFFRPTKLRMSVENGSVVYSGEYIADAPNLDCFSNHEMSTPGFDQKNAELTAEGYTMESHASTVFNGEELNAAVWILPEIPPPFVGLNSAEFQQKTNIASKRDFRSANLVMSVENDTVLYSGDFIRNSPNQLWQSRHDMTTAEFDQINEELTTKGYTLECHASATAKGKEIHAAVWVVSTFSGQ